ncbi:MAG: hypothetical protein EBS06_05370 [Proteobacteria bacterium]|nr:hypothetical protein [Pseudomonadota bacterium]
MRFSRSSNDVPCATCKQYYEPYPNDWANCQSCNDKEHQNLLKNYLDQNSVVFRPQINKGLSDYLVKKIRIFVCKNYGVLFKKKKNAFVYVNIEFGLNLTREAVESITNTRVLKKLGMKYQHKAFKKVG